MILHGILTEILQKAVENYADKHSFTVLQNVCIPHWAAHSKSLMQPRKYQEQVSNSQKHLPTQ
jgi:hypothetical protein